MIDRLIEFSVRRRGWILLAGLAWVIAGLIAIRRTPMDAVPDLSENQVLVFADWPGHGPEEVEAQLTYPLSLLFQGLPGVRVIRGSSDVGTSTLYLIFDDAVSFAVARDRVQNRLASQTVDVPAGVTPRLAAEGIPTGQIYWYTVEGQGHDLGELRALQDWTIAPQLRSVAGVAEVAGVGGFIREIQVRVDPASLLATGLSVDEIARAITQARTAVGGHVITKGNAEFVVEVVRPEAAAGQDQFGLQSLEDLVIPVSGRPGVRLGDVARVTLGAAPRRGMLEKDGNEVVGGVIHLRYGHNPLEVTRAVKQRLQDVARGLPSGVRILPCYDRTPLITGAVATVTRTLLEAILVACLCVVLVLRHWRSSLVIALALPLAVLGAFLGMDILRHTGLADVQTNIMSIAGIVISIGVLVDSSIVLCENVMHELRRRYGDRDIRGNVDATVIRACQAVGRPVFYSLLIMLVSFLPVFALGGIDGKMYAPLAWTKTLSLVAAAILAVTLVPALSATLIRGRIRDESESAIVRTVIQVYRPVLTLLMDRPAPLVWILAVTLLLAAAALGLRWLLLGTLGLGMLGAGLMFRTTAGRAIGVGALLVLALVAESTMTPLRMELRLPLNEGMVMDMPITVPRASIAQSADDVKARDMVLCRFPEVQMVVGKAGRADTPFDPAPLDMIETMIEFRPREFWPRRRLDPDVARDHARTVRDRLVAGELIRDSDDSAAESVFDTAVTDGLLRFDAIQREVAHLLIQEFLRPLGPELAAEVIAEIAEASPAGEPPAVGRSEPEIAAIVQRLPPDVVRQLGTELNEFVVADVVAAIPLSRPSQSADVAPETPATATILPPAALQEIVTRLQAQSRREWERFVPELNAELARRAPATWTRIISEELILRSELIDADLGKVLEQVFAARYASPKPHHVEGQHHHGMPGSSDLPIIDPHPRFDELQKQLAARLASRLTLEVHDPESLASFGGEMDQALQMPGWTNVWTKPIQNRVDMLATGVNAEVGVRVMGRNLDDVVRVSEDVARVLRDLPGAADVVADPVRGKGYIRIIPDPAQASRVGASLADVNTLVETALTGRIVAHEFVGRERIPVRLKLAGDPADDELTLRRLTIPVSTSRPASPAADSPPPAGVVTLETIADVRVTEGPATIKSENGWLRNYVRLNVRGQDVLRFVDEARRVVAAQVVLPEGVFLEWTGQYEHSLAARQRLLILMPIVLGSIVLILFFTYRDWADAALMALSVPGALAGGVLCQWLLGYPFSIAVGMGYIACFGMAAATGIVMLVYLREAVSRAGGLEAMSLEDLREAVLNGAVHRLRPKLLTEATTILGLAPILWSTGVGAEVIRPMAAPVLGGLLVADEVIDLLLPVLFYHVRRARWQRLHPGLADSAVSETPPSPSFQEVLP